MGFPRPFYLGAEPCAQNIPVIAIALELVRQRARRAQQVDRCGACAAADGEWCAALNVVASRGFRWQRARRGPERPPVLQLLTAPALPIA